MAIIARNREICGTWERKLPYSHWTETRRIQIGRKHAGTLRQNGLWRANLDSPIFEELRSIVSKTVGVREQVRAALEKLESRISLALIYGSLAKGSDTANSDIDVLIVSDELTLEDVFSCVSGVESQLGRRINPTLYTTQEFNYRRDNGSAFLNGVLEGPTTSVLADCG